jgi:hypothetical protein
MLGASRGGLTDDAVGGYSFNRKVLRPKYVPRNITLYVEVSHARHSI